MRPAESWRRMVVTRFGATQLPVNCRTWWCLWCIRCCARRCYLDLLERLPARSDEEFVFFPKFKNRAHASRVAANQFNFVLGESGLKEDRLGQLRTLYSLRHFGIQARLAAQMPIYDLAKNAGTSVEMIERFYGRLPAYSEQRAEIMNTGLVQKELATRSDGTVDWFEPREVLSS